MVKLVALRDELYNYIKEKKGYKSFSEFIDEAVGNSITLNNRVDKIEEFIKKKFGEDITIKENPEE